MPLTRVTKGIPKYNIQIGPIKDALGYNPDVILSVTDYFEPSVVQMPRFHWVLVNEMAKTLGYLPFFAVKRLLDFYCLELPKTSDSKPFIYLTCLGGIHRSPLMAFCWLLSQKAANLESVSQEFYGKFSQTPIDIYTKDLQLHYIPNNLEKFYFWMRQYPTWSYQSILDVFNHKQETTSYNSKGYITI